MATSTSPTSIAQYQRLYDQNPKLLTAGQLAALNASKGGGTPQTTGGGTQGTGGTVNDPRNPNLPTKPTPPKPVVEPKPPVPKPVAPKPTTPAPTATPGSATVTPGVPPAGSKTQIGVVDLAGQLATDPGVMIDGATSLQDTAQGFSAADIKTGLQDPNSPFAKALKDIGIDPATVNATTVAAKIAEKKAATVQTDLAYDKMVKLENQMKAATGTVSDKALVDPKSVQTDVNATAQGKNELGKALNESAQQNISNIIDTSTAAGKALAAKLGEGNYTDMKATVKGQLDILQSEFFDPATGEAKIPSWAQGTMRNVSKIATFSGMTGSAATAAMAQAMMEASIPVAQADAQFFQTVTLKNLDNRQEATINKANVLSKLELANLDARTQVAVNNANQFMQMDLANLDNKQQASLINAQARQQAILEDSKAVNANRLFMAESQNEKDMFYANLEASINQFNATQKNNMAQFNAGEVNDVNKFNADLENNREQFYKTMQFQVDTANAKWRQTVTLTENAQDFEAASTDVKNAVGISVEQLNQLWDRADALLDYAFKGSESEKDRKISLALAQMQSKDAEAQGSGDFWGTILGAAIGAFF